jgi:hypothetical protein
MIQGAARRVARPDAARQLSLVTLVFDQLGETRRQAQKAAELPREGPAPDTFVTVFASTTASMVQAFTTTARS